MGDEVKEEGLVGWLMMMMMMMSSVFTFRYKFTNPNCLKEGGGWD